jgi:hypothetical protein
MAEIITCPTGLTGRIRGMKVREERILSDRRWVPRLMGAMGAMGATFCIAALVRGTFPC